jgi:hypothetical protein
MTEQGSIPGIKWCMSADGRTLTVKRQTAEGIIETNVSWTFDPTQDLIDKGLKSILEMSEDREDMLVGQKNKYIKKGKWVLEISTGPPTWWLPRIELKFKEHFLFRLGWLRLGLGLWK